MTTVFVFFCYSITLVTWTMSLTKKNYCKTHHNYHVAMSKVDDNFFKLFLVFILTKPDS